AGRDGGHEIPVGCRSAGGLDDVAAYPPHQRIDHYAVEAAERGVRRVHDSKSIEAAGRALNALGIDEPKALSTFHVDGVRKARTKPFPERYRGPRRSERSTPKQNRSPAHGFHSGLTEGSFVLRSGRKVGHSVLLCSFG